MGKIKQLPLHEAQKIAAGEVVERPANVVKELIENALDAGASTISLSIEDGGKALIRIIDNGCGMSEDDAKMSIVHHATSKIQSVDELEQISTFGFRGEALSSISAVARVTLITKEEPATTGTKLKICGSSIESVEPIAANTGTDISITDLFYNVPARKKFLKTSQTEWRSILHLFQAIALDYMHVNFKLFHDNRQIYHCPATTSLQTRLEQIFEPLMSKHTRVFHGHIDRMNLRVHGVLTNPGYTRYDKNQIFVFVNRRWVKNYKLVNAFIKGYQAMLTKNQFPAGTLFIEIDSKWVDINIHPRKEEVQFLHPKIVEQLIEDSVKEALQGLMDTHLGAAVAAAPIALTEHSKHQAPQSIGSFGTPKTINRPFQIDHIRATESHTPEIKDTQRFLNIIDTAFNTPQPAPLPAQPRETEMPASMQQAEAQFVPAQTTIANHTLNEPAFDYKLIGQALKTYIVIETANGLTFIDQHAAHERVLYERFKAKFEDITPVRLLFPVTVPVSVLDADLIEPYLDVFYQLGIKIDRLQHDALIISQSPLFLKNQPIDDLIRQVISLIDEHSGQSKAEILKQVIEKIHAQIACKSAVKAGDELSMESMREIITQLYKTKDKLTCPHGRPTIWALTLSEIEKKFKRDYR